MGALVADNVEMDLRFRSAVVAQDPNLWIARTQYMKPRNPKMEI